MKTNALVVEQAPRLRKCRPAPRRESQIANFSCTGEAPALTNAGEAPAPLRCLTLPQILTPTNL
jgi:hypothetical protein